MSCLGESKFVCFKMQSKADSNWALLTILKYLHSKHFNISLPQSLCLPSALSRFIVCFAVACTEPLINCVMLWNMAADCQVGLAVWSYWIDVHFWLRWEMIVHKLKREIRCCCNEEECIKYYVRVSGGPRLSLLLSPGVYQCTSSTQHMTVSMSFSICISTFAVWAPLAFMNPPLMTVVSFVFTSIAIIIKSSEVLVVYTAIWPLWEIRPEYA